MKRAPSFGMVMVLVVMAVVLMMVAKAWRSTAPAIIDTQNVLDAHPASAHGEKEAAEAVRSGELPGLEDAQRTTDAHAAQVREAMQAVE
jgi:hypothetical protein